MAHELGHCVGLVHTNYYGEACVQDYPIEGAGVWNVNGASCDPALDSTHSNNILAYNYTCRRYLSPHQIERAQFNLRNTFLFRTLTPESQHYVQYAHSVFDLNVVSTQTWTIERFMKGNVIVKAGNTLTIKCRVDMLINGKIIVEKGARLIIDGGEVTTLCKDGLWGGIEIIGTYNQDQLIYNPTGLSTYQGIVNVINNGTISNARNGITTGTSDNAANFDYGTQGGIVICDSANFINNIRDIRFMAYDSPNGNDVSKFTNCNFKITGALLAGAFPITRISMWGVTGVKFLGCNFEYAGGNAYTPSGIGCGIYSIDSRYTIDELCNNNSTPCNSIKSQSKFTGFDQGVYVANSNPLKIVGVKNTKFYDNNYNAAYFQNTNYPVFLNNYVRTPGIYGPTCGLYLNNCKYYNVKNNTIEQDLTGTGGSDVGMWIWNSGDGAHEVYHNTFSNLYAGIIPEYNNSGQYNNNDGLKMNCNDFTQTPNLYDIGLLGTNPTVMKVQGESWAPAQTATNIVRNKYAATCTTNENKWHIVGTSVKGYQHGSNSDNFALPDYPSAACKDPLVNVVNSGIALTYSIHCPSDQIAGGGGGAPAGLVEINAALAAAIVTHNSLTASYNSVVDGGNTTQLLNLIASTISNSRLKDTMQKYSPYLSDTVLINYFNRDHSSAMISVHNLNKPVDPNVWQSILSLSLSSSVQSALDTQQDTVKINARQGMESQLSLMAFDVQAYSAEKIKYFLTDSLLSSADSVISMLTANIGDMKDADIQLVYAYMSKGDFSGASTQVSALGSNRSDWSALLSKLIAVQQNTNNVFSLLPSSTDMAFMANYADTDDKDGQMAAQSVLRLISGNNYSAPRLLPNSGLGARTGQSENKNLKNIISVNDNISVYPNPAQTGVNVVYKAIMEGETVLELKDILGRSIFSSKISSLSNNYIPLNNINNGIYFVSITNNKQLIYQSKIIKQD